MIVFSISDKGGTGRSVTSCNLAYRLCADARNVVFLDFDFGSPTAGALFEISAVERGVRGNAGLHSYLLGRIGLPTRVDVRATTDRAALRKSQPGFGKLTLLPGDEGGAEFLAADDEMAERCATLLSALDQECHVTIVDLSAGRSAAVQIALKATAMPQLRKRTMRWLVFHRWTRQHILAASGLVHGEYGIVATGAGYGHDRDELLDSIRYVRTAVPAANSHMSGERPAQSAWLLEQDNALKKLAAARKLGTSRVLGETPIEPMLQWREQIILDVDVQAHIANETTAQAFGDLASKLIDPDAWEGL